MNDGGVDPNSQTNPNLPPAVPNIPATPGLVAVSTPPVPPTPPTPPTPPAPIAGSVNKEAPAFENKPVNAAAEVNWSEADQTAKSENDKYWMEFANEIEAEKRAEEIGGVEKIESGEVPVPSDLAKEMGVRAGKPVAATMSGNFSVRGITYTDEQLATGLKMPTSSGIRWLVEWFIYQLLKAHFHVKRLFGGKVEVSGGEVNISSEEKQ